jgi:Mg-chelatase subunit ChlD
LASDLLRFDKDKGRLFLKNAGGERQEVKPPTAKIVFVLLDRSGSMSGVKFADAKSGAMDFGLSCIDKGYQVGVVVFSDKASATSPTIEPVALRAKINKLECTDGGTFLESALAHTTGYNPSYVVVVTDGQVTDAEQALEVATRLKSSGTEILTIGTDDADKDFLQRLASRSDLGIKIASAQLAQAISDTSRMLR